MPATLFPGMATLPFAQSVDVSQLLTEGAGTLILLAAAILVYRSFRERYLGIWISGWLLYSVHRETTIASQFLNPGQLLTGISQLSFVAALVLLVWAMLVYTDSNRFLPALIPLSALSVACVVLRVGWFPHSTVLMVLFHVLYRIITAIGAVRLALFSRGRREVGPWLMVVMLLLVHFDESVPSGHAIIGVDVLIEILLGLSILVIVLDDSRAGKHRLEVFNALTTAIAESRNSDSMMQDALEQLSRLMGSRFAWVRLLEGESMVLRQHIGLGDKLAGLRPEVPFRGSMLEKVGSGRAPVIVPFSSLDGELRQEAAKLGLSQLIILPLKGNASLLGALILGIERHRRYSIDEKRFLITTSNHLGLALENVQLFEQIMGSHRRWISTFDSIDDLILVHDGEQRIIRANRAFVQRLKRNLRGVLGQRCRELLPNAPQGCPYCLRAGENVVDAPDPCFGGFSTVSTSSYSEELGTEVGTIHVIRDTTDMHLAEERFRVLFEKMQEGVFVSTPQRKLLDCNEAFMRMLGFNDKSEVFSLDLNRHLYSLPEDRAGHQLAMERDGFVRNFEFVHHRRDGSVATLLENSFATRDRSGEILRYQGFLFDITEKKHAEEEIRRRNRELHALNAIAIAATRTFDIQETAKEALGQAMTLFGAAAASILLLEPGNGRLRLCATEGQSSLAARGESYQLSARFWTEFMAPKTELISASRIENLPREIQAAVDPEMRRVLCVAMWASQHEPLGLFLVSRRDDREFTADDHGLMVTMARQLAISIERTRLYTETKRAYQDLRNTQEQLLQSEKMSALGRMISGVAHELNNPLTAILGYAQLIETEGLNEQAKDFLAKLYKQVQRTQKIVHNLLSFSRQQKPYKGKIDLAQVLEETLSLREPDLELNHILVVRSIQTVPSVVADAHQLEQVFLNIINNAADAILENSQGGKLEVSIFQAGGFACVEFHDSGPGIADLSRVFDPFYTTKKLGKGTGLGLSICYGIMKEHSGEITASNHLQGGAVFQVRLPLGGGMADRDVQATTDSKSAPISAKS
jgi:two-component system NtrC family sensor kinase